MRYSVSNALKGIAYTLFVAGVARADDCSDGPANQPIQKWGKDVDNGGFCHTQWTQGLVVTGIEVWATAWQITGVQMTYSDGTKAPLQGQTNGDRHDAINWGAQDTITKMAVGNNYAGDGLGIIHIEVGGKTFDVRTDIGSTNGEPVTLATGLLIGASGNSPDFVRVWRPLFMGTTDGKAAKITSMKFDDDLDDINKRQQGIKSVSLDEAYYINSSPDTNITGQGQIWAFTGSQTGQKSTTLSTTQQNTFGLSESIEVSSEIGIPELAKVNVKSTTTASYEYSSSTTSSSEDSQSTTLSWSLSSTDNNGLITPGHAMHCSASVFRGEYSGGYTSTVEFTVNGKVFTFTQKGQINSISWSQVSSSCNAILASEIPDGSPTKDIGANAGADAKSSPAASSGKQSNLAASSDKQSTPAASSGKQAKSGGGSGKRAVIFLA